MTYKRPGLAFCLVCLFMWIMIQWGGSAAVLCSARDPVSMTLDDLFAKSDAVVLASVKRVMASHRYRDLDVESFDEFAVVVEIRSTLKGETQRKATETIIAYKSNGKSMPGNFGSTMNLFDQEFRGLHLLYLRKRGDTWMPTSGYVDGGNSDFLLTPCGFVD